MITGRNITFTAYYCEKSFINVILPSKEIKPDESKKWLIIGYPGVDGIEFRVKNNEQEDTVYAFYPIENEYIKIANSPEELILKWKEEKLTL